VTTKLSRCFAVLAALALLALAPERAFADNGHGGGWDHGHGGGSWHGGGGHYHGGGYWHGGYYPRPGFVVGALPGSYTVVSGWGAPYYYGAGAWYRPYGPRFVVVGAPIGAVVPFLPPYYATYWVGGVPYYCAGDTYYQGVPGGYAVVGAPPNLPPQPQQDADYGSSGSSEDEELFIYPERGQSESRQSDDRYACHRWAVDQSGYDPTRALEGVQSASGGGSRSDYQRAMTACLSARGYSVR
jgi:hypothetical protein